MLKPHLPKPSNQWGCGHAVVNKDYFQKLIGCMHFHRLRVVLQFLQQWVVCDASMKLPPFGRESAFYSSVYDHLMDLFLSRR